MIQLKYFGIEFYNIVGFILELNKIDITKILVLIPMNFFGNRLFDILGFILELNGIFNMNILILIPLNPLNSLGMEFYDLMKFIYKTERQ